MADRRAVTWQTLFLAVALPVMLGGGGFMVRDIYAEVKSLRDQKVNREEFNRAEKATNEKLDIVIQMLRDHESNSRRRMGMKGSLGHNTKMEI